MKLGLAKTRLSKFKGISKKTFYLHLKECEVRFNYKKQDICPTLLMNQIQIGAFAPSAIHKYLFSRHRNRY